MAWILWSLPEIEADFLAIYHREVQLMDRTYRDTGTLTGPRFLNFCEQLPAYQGAMRAAAMRWEANRQADDAAESRAVLMLDPDLEVG